MTSWSVLTRTTCSHSLPPLAAASKLTGPDGYLAICRAALPRSLAGLDVITGGVLGRAAVGLPGDVVQVVALAQRRHDRHYALRLHGLQRAVHAQRVVRGCGAFDFMPSRVAKQAIKIRNEAGKRSRGIGGGRSPRACVLGAR
jgi:hypothetical protein